MTSSSLAELCDRFLKVVELRDSTALLDMFTEHAVVTDWGTHFVGPAAIREWNNSDFLGAEVKLMVRRIVDTEDRVAVSATVSGKAFNGPSTLVLIPANEHQLKALQISQ